MTTTKANRIRKALAQLFDDTDATPDEVLREMHEAWSMHCAAREQTGFNTIKRATERSDPQ